MVFVFAARSIAGQYDLRIVIKSVNVKILQIRMWNIGKQRKQDRDALYI